jgi:hypothetical protein
MDQPGEGKMREVEGKFGVQLRMLFNGLACISIGFNIGCSTAKIGIHH